MTCSTVNTTDSPHACVYFVRDLRALSHFRCSLGAGDIPRKYSRFEQFKASAAVHLPPEALLLFQQSDHQPSRFGLVDVVFDTVGGETLERSWDLLKPGGRLATIAADAESSTDPRVKNAFFIVEQDGEQLATLGKPFDSGELKAFVKAELPMEEADRAYSGSIAGNPGKLVIWTK